MFSSRISPEKEQIKVGSESEKNCVCTLIMFPSRISPDEINKLSSKGNCDGNVDDDNGDCSDDNDDIIMNLEVK